MEKMLLETAYIMKGTDVNFKEFITDGINISTHHKWGM